MSAESSIATPLEQPTSSAAEFLTWEFFVLQILRRVQTVTLVKIVELHGGGLAAPGTVDVLPLVNQVDGAGNSIPETTLYGRPYMRWQGGNNGIILDPQATDIGIMVFASRDLSSVLSGRTQAPPPSGRIFSFSDGLYLGGLPNGVPTSYLYIAANGAITLKSTQSITVNGVTIDTSGNLTSPSQVKGATLDAENGATGTFESESDQTITVQNGIITSIG